VRSLAFGPDQRTLASASGERVWLWNIDTLTDIRALAGASPLAVSPDGKHLATATGRQNDESALLWDPAAGTVLRRCSGHQNLVRSLDFSPDGLKLVSGSFDQTVRHWEVAGGMPLHTFQGHHGVVYAVAYGPRGKAIASASFDKSAQLWDPLATDGVSRVRHRLEMEESAWRAAIQPRDIAAQAGLCF
jgi:WD40 repeat protein